LNGVFFEARLEVFFGAELIPFSSLSVFEQDAFSSRKQLANGRSRD
jgi:hypothetical protein